MNTDENKSMLWELLIEMNGFKESIGVEKNKELFENVISDIDKLDIPLIDKNKRVIDDFILKIQKIDSTNREEMFEERLKQNQQRYKIQPPNKELIEIKKLLYHILDKIDSMY